MINIIKSQIFPQTGRMLHSICLFKRGSNVADVRACFLRPGRHSLHKKHIFFSDQFSTRLFIKLIQIFISTIGFSGRYFVGIVFRSHAGIRVTVNPWVSVFSSVVANEYVQFTLTKYMSVFIECCSSSVFWRNTVGMCVLPSVMRRVFLCELCGLIWGKGKEWSIPRFHSDSQRSLLGLII